MEAVVEARQLRKERLSRETAEAQMLEMNEPREERLTDTKPFSYDLVTGRTRPITASFLVDSITPRASPREMRDSWREENFGLGPLKQPLQTSRAMSSTQVEAAFGTQVARLKEQKAKAEASKYKQGLAQLQGQQAAVNMQISALRQSHDALGQACGDLERKLRAESDKVRKQARHLVQQRKLVAEAEEREAGAKKATLAVRKELESINAVLTSRTVEVSTTQQRVLKLERLLEEKTSECEKQAADLEKERAHSNKMRRESEALEERLMGMRQAHEQARVAAMQDNEARRTEESRRLATEVELAELRSAHAATQAAFERERKEHASNAANAAAAATTIAELNHKVETLEEEAAAAAVKMERLARERVAARKELEKLRGALRATYEGLLANGPSQDPVRLHNEKLFSRLAAALKQASFDPAAPVAGKGDTPLEMLAIAEEQRESSQTLLAGYEEAKTRAEWREAKLRKQVRELRGRLQRYGADVEVRAEICAEMDLLGHPQGETMEELVAQRWPNSPGSRVPSQPSSRATSPRPSVARPSTTSRRSCSPDPDSPPKLRCLS